MTSSFTDFGCVREDEDFESLVLFDRTRNSLFNCSLSIMNMSSCHEKLSAATRCRFTNE